MCSVWYMMQDNVKPFSVQLALHVYCICMAFVSHTQTLHINYYQAKRVADNLYQNPKNFFSARYHKLRRFLSWKFLIFTLKICISSSCLLFSFPIHFVYFILLTTLQSVRLIQLLSNFSETTPSKSVLTRRTKIDSKIIILHVFFFVKCKTKGLKDNQLRQIHSKPRLPSSVFSLHQSGWVCLRAASDSSSEERQTYWTADWIWRDALTL